jgi:hypothetical protein
MDMLLSVRQLVATLQQPDFAIRATNPFRETNEGGYRGEASVTRFREMSDGHSCDGAEPVGKEKQERDYSRVEVALVSAGAADFGGRSFTSPQTVSRTVANGLLDTPIASFGVPILEIGTPSWCWTWTYSRYGSQLTPISFRKESPLRQ